MSGSFRVGIDYHPLDSERSSWQDWYDGDVEEDFALFDELGITMVRVFVSWRMYEPQVGQYDGVADERLDAVISAARGHGVPLLVTLFAGDLLGQLTEVSWGKKRDPRTDGYMLERERALVQRLVNRYRNEPVVHGWELANEAFLSGFEDVEALEGWATRLRETIREIDAERPIALGADPETLYQARGMDASAVFDASEFVTSHVTAPYRAYAAEGPLTYSASTYLSSFLLRSAMRDLPVYADGIGVFSLEHSLADEAAYVRTCLYSAVMNRASGAFVRRLRDVDAERREPYFLDPYEVLVGVADIDGFPKRSSRELAEFAETVGKLDLDRWALSPERAAVVVPGERFDPLPSLAGLFAPRACLQGYMSAKEAHVPVDVIREEDGYGAFQALYLPSPFALREGTWDRLAEFVQGGGAVVMSYGGGDAHPAVRELFGVEFLGDSGPRSALSCRVAQPDMLGDLESFDVALEVPHFALLGHGRATVVATDAEGSPLATMHQHGQGRAVFLAAPLERALAQGDPWAAPVAVRRMLSEAYGSVAAGAGAGGPVACDSPEVEVAVFAGEEDAVVLLLNHGAEKVVAGLEFDREIEDVSDLRGGASTEVSGYTLGVPFRPNGTVALRVSYAGVGADHQDELGEGEGAS